MIERFIHEAILKAKANSGASPEAAGLAVMGGLFAVTALIFLSIAAYAGLLPLYGSAIAWLIVGGAHLLIAIVAILTCLSMQKRTRAAARLQLEIAERQRQQQAQQSAWKFDPSYLAIGLEVAKAIGIKRLIPVVIGGILAAGFGSSRRPK